MHLTCGGILLTNRVIASQRELTLLNVYGPCSEQKSFWNLVADSGLLSFKNLIIVGNLSITISPDEVLGGNTSAGSMAG